MPDPHTKFRIVSRGQQRNHKAEARTHPHQSRPERMTSEPALHKLLAFVPQRSSCLAWSQCAIRIALSRSACTAAVLLVSVLVPLFTVAAPLPPPRPREPLPVPSPPPAPAQPAPAQPTVLHGSGSRAHWPLPRPG